MTPLSSSSSSQFCHRSTYFSQHRHTEVTTQSFKTNINDSKFAQHSIDNGHSFGEINNMIKILHFSTKGAYMDTVERCNIDKHTEKGNQLMINMQFLKMKYSRPYFRQKVN
jgi:hypothetical protein